MANGHFADVSVARISSEAGIARSTFYLHYNGRVGMLKRLAAQAIDGIYEAQRSWLTLGSRATRADVSSSMSTTIGIYLENEAVVRALLEESAVEPELRAWYATKITEHAQRVEAFIVQAQADGRGRDVEPASTALALVWMTERTITQLVNDELAVDRATLAQTLADIVWRTLHIDD